MDSEPKFSLPAYLPWKLCLPRFGVENFGSIEIVEIRRLILAIFVRIGVRL